MNPNTTSIEETEDIDLRLDREYKSGISVGADQERKRISAIIWEKSCAAFMDNKDDEARKLRQLYAQIQKP